MPTTVPPAEVKPSTIPQKNISSPDWLEELALNLAQNLVLVPHPGGANPLSARLKALGIFLQAAYRYFEESSRAETTVSHTAEWMLDNFYIIEQALSQTSENLPPDFYKRLPKAEINGDEITRIHILAFALTNTSESRLDANQIKGFIQTFQSITALRIGEIWAFAPMLRLSVLETLVNALTRITHLDLPPTPFPNHWGGQPFDRRSRPRTDDEAVVVNSILSLRMLATQDWQEFFENVCVVEDILRSDPAGIYTHMDFETRNRYRNIIEELTMVSRADEITAAREAIRLARNGERPRTQHVGYYLIGPGRSILEALLGYRPLHKSRLQRWLYNHTVSAYLGGITVLTVLLSLAAVGYTISMGGSALQIILTILLVILPASAVAIDLVNWLIVQIVSPRILPRLDFQDGIPREFSTMVVIPSLLKNESELEALLRQLETHYLGNIDPNIRFALLTDFVDAPQKELPGEAQMIEKTIAGIEQLNAHYGEGEYHPFYLFHRERIWNPAEGCWMGWERKRGKLTEFNNLLGGKQTATFTVRVGDLSVLSAIRYVVTLDADTTIPRDSIRHLTGILAHPLNQAEFDPETGSLIDGYTVIQPRVQVRPMMANRSIFTRVYSGDITLDLYTRAVSDVYQDLFGEGSYIGKGIYDVAAFERSLAGRIPDNTLLSHDLFEGIHGRCGLATNVVLFEDYPSHYLTYTKRLHRWIRGDWQLLPWLKPTVPHNGNGKIPNDLSVLDRWKILDNLRRSLVSPSIMALMIGGWTLLPGVSLVWITLALSSFSLAVIFGLIAALRARRTDQYPETTARPVHQAALRELFQIVFLPYESLVALDAIATTLVRMTITRKRLLQWVTAAHTLSVFGVELKIRVAWHEMIFAPLFSIILFLLAIHWNPSGLWLEGPFLIGWMLSPYFAVRISRATSYEAEKISPQHERRLHQLARTTWLYFEKFIGPDDHWLPPDHFQEDPRGLIAHRTSPTNIGLLLLSTLSAYDLGYIGLQDLVLRVRNTLDGMDKLEKQRGHFLNWYDTHTLNPLPPRYISTVDSGNLAACLLTLRQGCQDVASNPLIHWDGLIDTLDILDVALHQVNLGSAANELHEVISRLKEQTQSLRDARQGNPQFLTSLFRESRVEMEELLARVVEESTEQLDTDTIHRLSTWIDRTRHHLAQSQHDLENLCPWSLAMALTPALFNQPDIHPDLTAAWNDLLSVFSFEPSLMDVPVICTRALDALQRLHALVDNTEQDVLLWCESFASQMETARTSARKLLEELQVISARAETHIQAMNFRFLYDPQRKVFHIGYNVDSGKLDTSYYDLLASEARLTSLIAIAKGDVPQNHWLHLARPITQLNGTRALISWSGTMFEYLMPTLLTRRFPNTLLDQSCYAAVERQIAYGQSKRVPWGISESGFYYFDANQAYQYRAFGVPGLGYKRGLAEDLVVSPYASILALSFAPLAVLKNLDYFQKLNMFGLYGLYEAADFSVNRLETGQDCAIVHSYMAHHQGMILLSLCNCLRNDIMIGRFHADPRVETVRILLQEQIPVRAPIEHPHPHEIGVIHSVYPAISLSAWKAKLDAPHPQVHFLSNGNYGLLITAAGSGYSRWREVDLTRWRADTTLDQYGMWIYIQDRESNQLWSAGLQPTAAQAASQETRFYPHTVEFIRRDGDISTTMSIAIAPDADVEIRRITLTNHGDNPRIFALTSYAEIILSPQAFDQRHPAFNQLFISSEFLPEEQVLLFHRRLRDVHEKPIYLAHFFTSDHERVNLAGYETDRARFLERGGTARHPIVFSGQATRLSRTTGATLDPICALQAEIELLPYESIRIAFVTLAASSRKEAIELARRYRRWPQLNRAMDDARIQAEQELTQLGLTSKDIEWIQKLLSPLLYPSPALRAESLALSANILSQPGLWSFGISGDYPILLVRLKGEEDLDLLEKLLLAHTYWRKRGLMIDLVIFNQRETSYEQGFHEKIIRAMNRTDSAAWLNKRGGIFILREDQMSNAERILLTTAARVVLDGGAGALEQQLSRLDTETIQLPHFVPIEPQALPAEPAPGMERPTDLTWNSVVSWLEQRANIVPAVKYPTDLLFDNGFGGFTPDGREYIIHLAPGQWTPAPWINVIASPEFGCLVSETGLGCTWAQNSGENRLTPWRNDAVSDLPSEAIYLRDEDTGQVWSPTPLPARADAPYLIRHGAGYSVFEHASHGLEQSVRIFVVPHDPVKIIQLKLHNTTARMRRIGVTYYAEWVLGSVHENMAPYIVPEFASYHFALLARNTYNLDFGKRVAFLASTREPNGVTSDRTEFLGRHGSYALPAALERVGLTPRVQPGADPCAALQLLIWLQPGETKEITFLFGQGADRNDAERLITHYQNIENIEAAWQALGQFWDKQLGQIQVKTPDAGMDLLLNRWLLYQSLASRFWGRTAFYQPGGAYGYRDQLQDVMAFIHVRPDMVRQHILDASSRQFEEGDVLHWWHPPVGRGVRTRCSDDMLWLPYVTAYYVRVTGDRAILDEHTSFLSAAPLDSSEHERYGQFPFAAQPGTLYEHCCRALAKGMTSGPHGLPLIGGGDWNDGMNNIGVGGTGESIWLGWFLYSALRDFARVCDLLPAAEQAALYRQQAETLRAALETSAWDESWYKRAYYDDGKPLGSVENHDCQIDSISQSWAVISGAGNPERAHLAMESLYEHLVRHDYGLILLLKPPFDRTLRDPGYIKGYLPGTRENGGQYTHAALWAIWAFAELGESNRVMELLRLINPIYHTNTPEKIARYCVEPYVVAADVYNAPSYIGRGGWTWYTGSASWMYRLVVEKILGLQREADNLRIDPRIPDDWHGYEIHYRFGDATYHITIENPHGVYSKVTQILQDGKLINGQSIKLANDEQEHSVKVTLG